MCELLYVHFGSVPNRAEHSALGLELHLTLPPLGKPYGNLLSGEKCHEFHWQLYNKVSPGKIAFLLHSLLNLCMRIPRGLLDEALPQPFRSTEHQFRPYRLFLGLSSAKNDTKTLNYH